MMGMEKEEEEASSLSLSSSASSFSSSNFFSFLCGDIILLHDLFLISLLSFGQSCGFSRSVDKDEEPDLRQVLARNVLS